MRRLNHCRLKCHRRNDPLICLFLAPFVENQYGPEPAYAFIASRRWIGAVGLVFHRRHWLYWSRSSVLLAQAARELLNYLQPTTLKLRSTCAKSTTSFWKLKHETKATGIHRYYLQLF